VSVSGEPISAEDLTELSRAWNLRLVTNGVERLVVPDGRFQNDLRHHGWWGLLSRDEVLGWLQTLQDEGVEKPSTTQIADRISAWMGLPASDEAYAAELARVGDASEPWEERIPGPHEALVHQVGGPLLGDSHVVGEWAATCRFCPWVSASSYATPLTAQVAGEQHLTRQGLTPPPRQKGA
jgi:hypothetical protein